MWYIIGVDRETAKTQTEEDKMINTNRSKNKDWSVGAEVKVGFLTLRVIGCRAEKDYMPDIYSLESLDGTKKYEFIPHNGLSRVA